MRTRSFIFRCAAFLLILVFAQKTVAGLFVHNLFHCSSSNTKIPGQEKGNDIKINCNCVDDFLMPFAGAEGAVIPQPALTMLIPFTIFQDNISFHTTVFSPLRGPPADAL
jgi:hypothetical protein